MFRFLPLNRFATPFTPADADASLNGTMRPLRRSRLILLALVSSLAVPLTLHGVSCSVAGPHPLTPEEIALVSGNLPQAESLYQQKLTANPRDEEAAAGLVRTLLREEKVDQANAVVRAALAPDPQSPVLLTALAEVQFRQGLPWDEEETITLAQAHGVCYPRLHLVLSRYFVFNSYYATALREIQTAHRLDPYDPAIQQAWILSLPLDQRIGHLKQYLAANDTDVASVRRARLDLAMLENRRQNQGSGCHLVSPVSSTNIEFAPILADAERVRGWGLEVAFNGHKARLQIDTGASGLYIARSVAEHAGLVSLAKSQANGIGDKGAQTGYTAIADSIKIGGLEFKNCVVQVSDRNNIVGTDGLIGMDVFSNFLVTLDFPWHKLALSPLPSDPGAAAAPASLNTNEESSSKTESSDVTEAAGPHDRYIAPAMKSWTKVYRMGHDLIVPTSLNGKTMRLFIVDTGAFRTSISPEAAREVTKVHSDGRSQVKGISGNVENVFSGDKVVVRFAGLQQESDNMLSFDTSGLSQHMGTDISGFLGFDLLHFLVLSIDYRDGLVDFQYSRDRGYQHIR
jgi:predicted aspartyl protease